MDKNPIDKDKVAEKPNLLPYAHHVGSAIIKPLDKGKIRGQAMSAMFQQTEVQLTQIKEQVETLIKQAQEIHDRIDISEKIYQAEVAFRPIIGNEYYLYRKTDKTYTLSLISPEEWKSKCPYTFIAAVTLLSDHTWKVANKSEEYSRFDSQF